MKIFVAGASGAIGQPLIAALVRHGHTVTGMTRSEAGARRLAALGAVVAQVSAFDAPALERTLRESRAEVVIDELTALPRHPQTQRLPIIEIGAVDKLKVREVIYPWADG